MDLTDRELRRRRAVATYLRARLDYLGLTKSDAAKASGRRAGDPTRHVIERHNFTRWTRDDPPPTEISPRFYETLREILRLSPEEWAQVLAGTPPPADAEPTVPPPPPPPASAEWRLASKLKQLSPRQLAVIEATVNALLDEGDAGSGGDAAGRR